MALSYVTKLGPWGNEASQNWSFLLAEGQAIKEIKIRHGFVVDALTFVLVDGAGHITTTDRVGGSGGTESPIQLDTSKEYITLITGTHGDYQGGHYITSMIIYTNLNPDGYGPFGQNRNVSNSQSFSTPSFNGPSIVGFHGGSGGKYLESVGIFVKQSIPAEVLGPWGDQGEVNWSFLIDKNDRISRIATRSGAVIDSIEFTIVDKDGKSIGNFKLGGPGGPDANELNLDASEYLTNISGTYGTWKGSEFVSSLTFHTNKRTVGPFGYDYNRPPGGALNNVSFNPGVNGSVVIGFFGKKSSYINSIGFYGTPI